MLERGHFLAEQEAKIRAQRALDKGDPESGINSNKQLLAVKRIREFTTQTLNELGISDISPDEAAANQNSDSNPSIQRLSYEEIEELKQTMRAKGISNRLINRLSSLMYLGQIQRLEDITSMSDNEILAVRNVGRKGLIELRNALSPETQE